jgi:phenylacetate-CoA ligase
MTKHIKNGLGKDVIVHYEYVDVISPLQSGKMKIFYSHMKE